MKIPHSRAPHGEERVISDGNTADPTSALILLHGRGGSATDIMGIVPPLDPPTNLLVLAPQGAECTWYPERFVVPQQSNQPYLDDAIDRVETLISFLEQQYHLGTDRIALAGFSQGACVVAEYLKRHPRKYLAAAIWSGGLIGTDSEVRADVPGSLADTPIYLGCDEADFHIPLERVKQTAEYLTQHDGAVSLHVYRDLGHRIHPEGLTFLQDAVFRQL